jgi:WD40 repeat protein
MTSCAARSDMNTAHAVDVQSAAVFSSCCLQLLASGSDDETVRIWRLPHGASASAQPRSRQCVAVLRGHQTNVSSTVFVPGTGDNHVVTGGNDGSCRLYDVTTQTQLSVMVHHSRKVFLPIPPAMPCSHAASGALLRPPRPQHAPNLQLRQHGPSH